MRKEFMGCFDLASGFREVPAAHGDQGLPKGLEVERCGHQNPMSSLSVDAASAGVYSDRRPVSWS